MSKWIEYEWIGDRPIAWKCGECGEVVSCKYNFCPECGDPKTRKGKSINTLVKALETEHRKLREIQSATDKNVGTNDTINRQHAIDAVNTALFPKINTAKDAEQALRALPPAQPHAYRGVTLNDVMMYFDSLAGNEDAWTEFCSCFECRGWGLHRIQNGGARQDFMDVVYDELADDPDNNRANRIIWAADEYATDKNVATKISREPLELARAIDGLTEWQKHVQTDSNINRDITVAIETLKAQLGTNFAEVGTDCISRQAAIEALGEQPLAWEQGEYEDGMIAKWESDVEAIKNLPPAQSTWKWIKKYWHAENTRECSACHVTQSVTVFEGRVMYNYCPYCGAKMEMELV